MTLPPARAHLLAFPSPTDTQQVVPPIQRRVAFVINSLGQGGAERVMDSILHAARAAMWDCHLILLDREDEQRTPPEHVKIHRLNSDFSLLASIRQLRRVLISIKPDLVVSFLVRANVASIVAARSVAAPCIISERSHLTTHLAGRHAGLKRFAARAAPRLVYGRADHVIAVSEGVRSDLVRNFGVRADRVATVANPYDLERIAQDAKLEPETPLPERFMISVGRLVEIKGFADLIDAYAVANPDIPLCILGAGPDRGRLEARISTLGLRGRVHLLGYVRNPFAVVGRAELFVSASHCEGFPNAMAEAMALGLPVIATDCPSGPAEILAGVETARISDVHVAEFGLLVPVQQPGVLARAITLMASAETRSHYAVKSRQRMQSFRIGTITDVYWDTFSAVLASKKIRT